jgi:2-polyprenyl-3-methyl-5-hydroxy-6-metoxy-1,4-benzoquinol methylase
MAREKNGVKYNCTQLTPQETFERHIYHRDQFAHYLRWTHVLRAAKIGQTILDFGCGSGEMLEVFYRNRYRPKRYLGLEVRDKQVDINKEKFAKLDFAEFRQCDLCQPDLDLGETFDIVTCFEVMEHIGHENADVFLDNLAYHCRPDTQIFLSTPNYDPQVGAADNHMLTRSDGTKEVGEWDHFELEKKLSEFFIIKHKYGTFASQRDYKETLCDWQIPMYEALKEYYDSNLIANIMAPLVPAYQARNCLWELQVKED